MNGRKTQRRERPRRTIGVRSRKAGEPPELSIEAQRPTHEHQRTSDGAMTAAEERSQ